MNKRKTYALKPSDKAKDERNPIVVLNQEDLKNKIYTIRGVQVILDRDLAELYSIETRALKQAVNRNKKRFPLDFMFILTENEVDIMVSQNVIPSRRHLGGAFPYVFTEQGIANLSSVLNSDKAIEINIQIMRAFVSMRKFISKNAEIFRRLDTVERKQLECQIKTDKNFEKVFEAIEDKEFVKKQGIFFDGQIFDAYNFVSDLIRSAKESIVLIDNFVDDSVLTLFLKRKDDVRVVIYTKTITKQLRLDLMKHNSQYPAVAIKEFKKSHDRFMIIDDKDAYHIGASLKDLGKK
ncbi:ORF6N domain-containing protein [archaeon]|nr:ORF6N domain-containing protein [archaeon]